MPIEINDEIYYTVNETLAYLGISRDTLYRRIDEGLLQKYTHGVKNRVYFRLVDLNALRELHPKKESDKGEESSST